MTVNELYEAFDARIPSALSAEWDNDGRMCIPDGDKTVHTVLCTLDVTDETVARAKEIGAELIVSHHPLVFSPLHALTPDEPVAARVLTLLSAGIAVFSFHTRFDAVEGGVNDALCARLSLREVTSFGEDGIGRIGTLGAPVSTEAFCATVKATLGAPFVNAFDTRRPVLRVAVVGGEGKDCIGAAEAAGADLYLSGRLGYHAMQDARISLVEAGHFYTERHAAEVFASFLKELAPTLKTEIYTPSPTAVY